MENRKEAELRLNTKILNLTLEIKLKYPELSKFIEEMPITVPDEVSPQLNLKKLNEYYDGLRVLLDKYILEHRERK